MRLLLLFFALALAPHIAAAQLIDLDAETVKTIRAQAEAARLKHPTSPTEAVYAFTAEFNGHFGDVFPADATLLQTDAISVTISTPLLFYRAQVLTALNTLGEIPDPLRTPSELFGGVPLVSVSVTPRQMGAPNISRLIVFSDDKPLETRGEIAPKTYTNRLGHSTEIGTGTIFLRASDFTSGGTIKIVAIATPKNYEWTISPESVKRFR